MVLPVRILTHCGIGLFCFNFFASFRLMMNVLWADWNTYETRLALVDTIYTHFHVQERTIARNETDIAKTRVGLTIANPLALPATREVKDDAQRVFVK